MVAQEHPAGLADELHQAIAGVRDALDRAAAASAALESLIPRVNAMSALFDDLESAIRRGRSQLGFAPEGLAPAPFPRPTLVVPAAISRPQPGWTEPEPPADIEPQMDHEPPVHEADAWDASSEHKARGGVANGATYEPHAETVPFRLEFESRPGPLDLRALDEAISEHPAVKDVALLDYDGRKATLKVWIVSTARPAEIQQALERRTAELFAGNDITVVALEDVA
jgi:hypothetical protein